MADDHAQSDSISHADGLYKKMDTLFPQTAPDRCRVCDEPVVDGRWNYCSERCRDIANAVQRMFSWTSVREQILDRDNHTCQACGLSREMQWRAYRQVKELIDEKTAHYDRPDEVDEWREHRRELQEQYGVEAPTGGFFHVDHITRVTDGGHPFDESNLQTLCKHCHGEKTAAENSTASRPEQEITLEDYLE